MDIKRGKSLYMIFLGYLISFCILSIIWIFSLVAFINISVNKDIIKPANYMENQVEKLKLEAKQGLKFDSSKIPYSSNYIFFDNKNKVVKANTNEDETKNIPWSVRRWGCAFFSCQQFYGFGKALSIEYQISGL